MTPGIHVATATTVTASALSAGTSVALAGLAGRQPWLTFHRLVKGALTNVALHVGGVELRLETATGEFDSFIVGAAGAAIEVVHTGAGADGGYSITCGYVAAIAGPTLSGR